MVSDAYDSVGNLEDDYKSSRTEKIETLTSDETKISYNKAEITAEAALKDKKQAWTKAKSVYNRYKLYLDRIDRILDEFKQYCSSVKMIDLKHGGNAT